jgi:hypothetical protein
MFLICSKVRLFSLYSNSFFARRSLLKALQVVFRTAGQKSLLSVSAENIARAETLLWLDCRETSVLAQRRDSEPLIQQRNSLDRLYCETNLNDVGAWASQIGMSPTRPPSIADGRSTVTDCVEDALAQQDFNPEQSVAFRTAGKQALLSVSADDMKLAEALFVSDHRDTSELLGPSAFKTQCLRRESSLGNVGTDARQIAVSDNEATMTNCTGDVLAQHASDPSLSVAFRTVVSADANHRSEALLLPDGSDASVLVQPISCNPHIQKCGSLECLRLRSNVDGASTGASRKTISSSKAPSTIDFGAASADCKDDDLLHHNSSVSRGFRTAGRKSVLSVSSDAMDRAHALLFPDGIHTSAFEQPSDCKPPIVLFPDGRHTSAFEQPSDCKPPIPQSSPLDSLRRTSSDMGATRDSNIAISSIRAPSIVGGEPSTGSLGDDFAHQSLDPSPSFGFRTAGQKSVLSISAEDITRATALLLPVGKDTLILGQPNSDKPFIEPRGSLECLRHECSFENVSTRKDKVATESKICHPNIDGSATMTTNNLRGDLQYDFDPLQASKTLRTPSAQHLQVFRGPFVTPGSSGYDDLRRQLIECSGRECKFLLFHHCLDRNFSSNAEVPSMKDGNTFAEAFASGNMISDANECSRFAVSSVTMLVNSENALRVRFDCVTLLPDSFFDSESAQHTETIGSVGDYRRALLELGCQMSFISEKWIKTHVRWINWKLASIERRFAQFLGGHYFTFPTVVGQLKHRYERELRDGARPILRRVLNRDVPASCMMILCVARVQNISVPENEGSVSAADDITASRYVLELTDGWYSVPAAPDDEICYRIANGGIRIGTKLLVSNSAMTGFDDGVDPLDDCFDPARPSCSPVLQLAANSTRIARWNAKLGRVSKSPTAHDGVLLVKRLADVKERGGPLPLFDVRVLQRYPLMFLGKSARPGDSKFRVLTEQDESDRLDKYEKQRLATIERVYEEIEAECEAVRCSCFLVFHLGHIVLTMYSCRKER